MRSPINHESRDGLLELEALFFQALEQPETQRDAFLDRACGVDVALRVAVERLLHADRGQEGLIDTAPWSADQVGRRLASGEDRDPLAHPGAEIGRYRLVEFLGAGGMGSVWLAERIDDDIEQRVALKLIKRGLDTDDILRRFRRERQVLAQLEHPNIARLIDGGATADGRPFLVMELVTGRPINAWCDDKRMGIKDRLRVFLAACEAVQHAHSRLTVHRDLKPGNILVTEDGQPKLLDFGLAKLLREDGSPDSLYVTTSGHRLYTPRYASPEQVRGDPPSAATDIYSLGVILYELLTGISPYPSGTTSQKEIERAITDVIPTRPSTIVIKVSDARESDAQSIVHNRSTHETALSRMLRGDLDTIVLKALAKDPERRYATVAELAEDIRRHLQHFPISAAPESYVYRAALFVRRNKGLAFGAITAALALVAATVVSTSFAIRESDARREAEHKTRVAERINGFLNEDLLSAVDPMKTDNPEITMREVLDRAASRIGDQFQDEPLVEAAIRFTIGDTYLSLQLPSKAVPHLRRAVELRDEALGDLHEDARRAKRQLFSSLFEAGMAVEGHRIGEELLALDIHASGSNSADAMDTRHLIALDDSNVLDRSERIEMLRTVLDWNRSNRGLAHPESLEATHSLANLYITNGELDKALPLIEEAYDIAQVHYQPSDQEALDAMLGLAILYGRTDRLEEAVDLLRKAIQIQRETKPRFFTDTGIWLTHLGIHLRELKRYDEAEAALLESYEILSSTLGTEAGWTQGTVRFLVATYDESGNVDQAAQWRARLIDSSE